jgi:hypothetical protein
MGFNRPSGTARWNDQHPGTEVPGYDRIPPGLLSAKL